MSSFPKAVEDLKGCIQALRIEHDDGHITDNSTDLHKFCVKLEYVLQIDMKGRVGIWGGRKDYWDYFCACLGKIKGLNDGVRFVKGMKEVKTSLGRGRAFIRYSLVHHRLGDTLQQCVSNGETTLQWYSESSILCQPSAFADLTNDLYDLNDVQFDLAPSGHELDTAWPTFARSAIGVGLYLWNPPTRSSSMASITSSPSQADGRGGMESMTEVDSDILDSQLGKLTSELEECEKYNRDLRHQLQTAQRELEENRSLALENEARMSSEIGELQRKNQELVFKSDQAVSATETAKQSEDSARYELESSAREHQRITGEFGERLETLKLQLSSETAMRQKHEEEKRTECLEYERRISELDVKLRGHELELNNLREVEGRLRANLEAAETRNKGLEVRIDKLTHTIDSNLTTRSEQLSQDFESINLLRSLFVHLSNVQSDNKELNNIKSEFYSKLEAVLGVDKVGDSKSTDVDVGVLNSALSRLEEGITETQQGLQEVKTDVSEVQTAAGTSPETGETPGASEEKIKTLAAELEEWKLTAEQQRNLVLDRDLRLKDRTSHLNQAQAEVKMVKETSRTVLEASRLIIQSLPDFSPQSNLPQFYFHETKNSVPYEQVLSTLPDLMREIEGRIGDISRKSEEVQRDLNQEQETRGNIQSTLDVSLREGEEMKQRMESLQEELMQTEKSYEEEKRKLQCLEEELESVRAEVVSKEEDLKDMTNCAQNKQSDLQAETESLKASLKESSEIAEEIKLKCRNFEEEVKSLNLEKGKLEEEKSLECQLKLEAEKEKIRLEEELALKSSQMQEIEAAVVMPGDSSGVILSEVEETTVKTVTEVMQKHEDKVEFMTEQFKLLKADLEALTIEKEGLSKTSNLLEKEAAEKRRACEDAESRRDEAEEKFEALSEKYKEVMVNYDGASSQLSIMKSELRDLKEESKSNKDKLLANDETIKKLDSALDCARETAKEHQAMIDEKTERLEEKLRKIDELEGKLKATEDECKNAKEVMEREVSAIEFQRSSEAMQYQVKLESFEKLNSEVTQWRDRCLELEENLGDMTEEVDKHKENGVNMANRHRSTMKEKEDECKKYQQDNQTLENSLVQISNQLERKAGIVVDLEEKVASMQKNGADQIEYLREKLEQKEKDNEELMAQIVKFGKDKNVIWQRLQKLETQRKSRAMERWIDDKDVARCMECEASFSLTVRRHHCRMCGGLYCSKCTDYSILTAQSKKRVRVCEKCFVLHTHSLEATGMDTSAIVDDSPEESVASFNQSRLSISSGSLSEPVASSSGLGAEDGEEGEGSDGREEERSGVVSPILTDETDTGEGKSIEANVTKVSSSSDGDFEVITDEDVSEVRQELDTTEATSPMEKPELTPNEPITSDEIMRTEGTQRELYLAAGASHQVPIIIREEGVILCWEFTSSPKSVAVKVSYTESLEEEPREEIVPLQRFNSHQQSASGELLTYKSGVYIVQFDNSFSRMTAKTVIYQLSIRQPDVSY